MILFLAISLVSLSFALDATRRLVYVQRIGSGIAVYTATASPTFLAIGLDDDLPEFISPEGWFYQATPAVEIDRIELEKVGIQIPEVLIGANIHKFVVHPNKVPSGLYWTCPLYETRGMGPAIDPSRKQGNHD